MKFGKVDNPELVDFTLPPDHFETKRVFNNCTVNGKINLYIGCAKWSKTELKDFYPKGTKDELPYYSTQFNAIELNASFYRIFPPEQFKLWKEKTTKGFKFFPKLVQNISHFKRLSEDAQPYLDQFLASVIQLEEKLGMCFLQTPHNFAPKSIDRLEPFLQKFPEDIPIAIEFRHKGWFEDPKVFTALCDILEAFKVTLIMTDSPGRRDVLSMRLTTNTAFIRFNSINTKQDKVRLDQWMHKFEAWQKQGLQNIYLFIHQKINEDHPLLAAYVINQVNKKLGTQLSVPTMLT